MPNKIIKRPSRCGWKKRFISGVLFVLLFATTAVIAAQGTPNLVLMISDDSTHLDFGCYGSPDSITPNIDQLAADGMRFTRCYQAAPMCSPTRHNLYTGIFPVKSGAYPNHTFAKPGVLSVVQHLKALGYRVALSGKRHIEPEVIFDFEYLGTSKNPEFKKVDAFIQDATSKGQPFCLFLCSNEPHSPWNKGDSDLFDPAEITLPPFLVDTPDLRSNFSKYLAEINYLDGQVGEALGLLDKYNIKDKTLFIFTSEQGNGFPFAKWTCYNAGLHTAFIARYPGVVEAGSVSDALIDYSDVVPTFIELAGGTVPASLDGQSIVSVLRGDTTVNKDYSFGIHTSRGIFGTPSDHYYGVRSVTDGEYRLIVNLTPEATFKNSVTKDGNWTYWAEWKDLASQGDPFAQQQVNAYEHRPAIEFYNVLTDPYCMTNLAEDPAHENRIATMQSALTAWMEECGDTGQGTELEALSHMHDHNPQPKMPTGLTAVGQEGVVALNWDDNTDTKLAGYKVLRSLKPYSGYEEIITDITTSNYADTNVVDGITYYYKVRAINNEGIDSWGSYAAFAAPGEDAGNGGGNNGNSTLFNPSDDAYALENKAEDNVGGAGELRVKNAAGKSKQSFLKFTVSGVTGTVESATLKLYSQVAIADTTVSAVGDNSWSESTLNWNNKPAIGGALSTVTDIAAGTWSSFDVSSLVSSNGTYSLALTTTSNGVTLDFDSKEASNLPVLEIVIVDETPVEEGDVLEGIVSTWDLSGVPTVEDALRGTVMEFDGSNGVDADSADAINLQPVTNMSWSVWFEASDATARQAIYEQGGKNRGASIYLDAGEVIQGVWGMAGASDAYIGEPVTAGEWHHAVLVLDGSTVKAYLDGTLINSAAGGSLAAHSGGIGIGYVNGKTKFSDGSTTLNTKYSGLIDDLRVYNRALTEEEVIRIFQFK